jgi:hypothetical protein
MYKSKDLHTQAIILPVLYGCGKLGLLPLIQKHRMKVFRNKVLRRLYGPMGEEDGDEENYLMRRFIICTNLLCDVWEG